MTSTSGTRHPATVYRASIAWSSPWLDVAVKVRTPVAAAAPAAMTIECSLSIIVNRPRIAPASNQPASDSMISVWGVIGKAGT